VEILKKIPRSEYAKVSISKHEKKFDKTTLRIHRVAKIPIEENFRITQQVKHSHFYVDPRCHGFTELMLFADSWAACYLFFASSDMKCENYILSVYMFLPHTLWSALYVR
jgi:hypothetical protein